MVDDPPPRGRPTPRFVPSPGGADPAVSVTGALPASTAASYPPSVPVQSGIVGAGTTAQRGSAQERIAALEAELARTRAIFEADRQALLEEQDGFIRGLIDEHESELAALRAAALPGATAKGDAPSQLPGPLEREATRRSSRPEGMIGAVAQLQGELEVARRTIEKLAEERSRSRDLLRRLQAQRDQARHDVATIQQQLTDLRRSVAPATMASRGGAQVPPTIHDTLGPDDLLGGATVSDAPATIRDAHPAGPTPSVVDLDDIAHVAPSPEPPTEDPESALRRRRRPTPEGRRSSRPPPRAPSRPRVPAQPRYPDSPRPPAPSRHRSALLEALSASHPARQQLDRADSVREGGGGELAGAGIRRKPDPVRQSLGSYSLAPGGLEDEVTSSRRGRPRHSPSRDDD